MKTNGTRILLIAIFLELCVLLISFASNAQPDYTFNSPTLISGVDRQIGAVYKYYDVKPGVDARVTISDISAGVSVVDIDAGSGYVEALQPTLKVDSNVRGYLEMLVEFLYAGTENAYVQTEVPATCIDVDGNLALHEFDQLDLGSGAYCQYMMLGNQVNVTQSGNWFTGSNTAGIEYPGRDTSARTVMFTVVNSNIASCIIRVGADNLSGPTQQRLRSVYWKKFEYTNSFLGKSALLDFRGYKKDSHVELQWNLAEKNNVSRVIVERGNSNNVFQPVGEVWTNVSKTVSNSFRFLDEGKATGTLFYRLRVISANGTEELSTIIAFREAANTKQDFRIYPTVINSTATVNVKTGNAGTGTLDIVDLSGRTILRHDITLQNGENNISVTGFDKLLAGSYVAILNSGGNHYTQKFIKQ